MVANLSSLTDTKAASLSEIANRLFRENRHPAIRRLTCRIGHGTLTISGQVPSYYLKQLAQTAVQHLPGVGRICNLVEVTGQPWTLD